jgi:hypothetical protein
LIDAWGTHSVVRGETEIPAGQLQVGDVTVTLFPVHPERPKPPLEDGADGATEAGGEGAAEGATEGAGAAEGTPGASARRGSSVRDR